MIRKCDQSDIANLLADSEEFERDLLALLHSHKRRIALDYLMSDSTNVELLSKIMDWYGETNG